MNFNRDHVNGGGTAIPGKGDVIATNCEVSAIGIGLLRTIVDAHASVCEVFALVDQDVVSSDEDDHVGAVANTGDALGKATEFYCVGLAPEFFILGVDKKVAHFHKGAGVGVEDGIENFPRELPTRSLVCHEWTAGDVIVNVDACQDGLLSDLPCLCATSCVARRGIIINGVPSDSFPL
jgi:hypothetical protein